MTNTDQLGYQIFTKRESINTIQMTSDVNMVPVSYEFIDIKGLSLIKEGFIMSQKQIQEQSCFR
jgi:putative ABC transport system permease protein